MNLVLRGLSFGSTLRKSISIIPRNSLSTANNGLGSAAIATEGETQTQTQTMEDSVKNYKEHVTTLTTKWKELNDIYYGKDRDMVNFPPLKREDLHPKVRLVFIPDSWFQAFYNKTGVTGPYIFFIGGPLFLMSKEFLVADHEICELLPFAAYLFILSRLAGVKLFKFTEKLQANYKELFYDNIITTEEEIANKIKKLVANEEKRKEIGFQTFHAKREMIDLQLEAVYRNRLIDAHKTVKSRLDYLVEKENTKRRFQHEHMVNWIINAVRSEITPQKQKEAMQKCITDLKAIAQSSAATA